MTAPAAEGILAGIRVVDMSFWLGGPMAAQLLAEAGATVIKVEPPEGDPAREHPGFATWNRSKRGVVLSLRNKADRDRLERLIESADVLIHGLTPVQAHEFGLDDDTLTRRYPQLVVSSILAYPAWHPKVEEPGWELLMMAWLGALDEIPGWRPGPIFVRFPLASWHAAYLGATGVVARLLHRHRSGAGGPAHTSLLQGALQQLSMIWNVSEPSHQQTLTAHRNDPPQATIYLCSDDRWIQITNFGNRINIPSIPAVAATLAELGFRSEDFDDDVLKVAMLQRTSQEWLEDFRLADLPVEPVADYGELLLDVRAEANDLVVDLPDPQWGRVRQAGPPLTLDPPGGVQRPAPRLGEHTVEVQKELDDLGPSVLSRTATNAENVPRGPLSHVRLLDFGQYLAGPFAPALLGDLGADVIKVEPVTGDRMRMLGAYFQSCQRGKRAIALDLTRPEGREVRERLLRWANAVHHNVRDRASESLGIDETSVRAVNPDLVFSTTNAYGTRGHAAQWPGFDPPFEALAGWQSLIAGDGNVPMYHRFAVLDQACALTSLLATTLALYWREVSGEARAAGASLLGGAVVSQSETMYLHDDARFAPFAHLDQDQTGVSPNYRIYRTRDDWLAIAAMSVTARASLLAVLEVGGPAELESAIADWTSADLHAALLKVGVPSEPVKRAQRVAFLEDDLNRARRLSVTFDHAAYGRISQIGELWSFGDLPLKLERSAPTLGQHSVEILTQLGYRPHEIEELGRSGVVAGPGLGP